MDKELVSMCALIADVRKWSMEETATRTTANALCCFSVPSV